MSTFRRRLASLGRAFAKTVLFAIAIALLLVVVAAGLIRTDWAKDQLRRLLVREANQYLTATLEIGALEGSLLQDIRLREVSLSRDGRPMVRIDAISLTFSLPEILRDATVIRQLHITRPHVLATRQDDGRWDLAALVRRDAQEGGQRGPQRAIHIRSIEVVDGTVELGDEVTLGAIRVPTRFDDLDAALSFDYEPVGWRLAFERASWVGTAPDLTVSGLTGGVSSNSAGLSFDAFSIQTPRSAFVLNGRIDRGEGPTTLGLRVAADRFSFQEWAGLLGGLRNIAVEAQFEARLTGPLEQLAVDLDLRSTGGSVNGVLVLNTRIPGWHATGMLAVARLDLADWLSRPERRSDISGEVGFDLDLESVRRFPRGSYTFEGPHAAFMGYEADSLRTRGTLDTNEVLIGETVATAYGANLHLTKGSIGLARPYAFRFEGTAAGVDLRTVPKAVPLPHVESTLAFDYDVHGQFVSPFITGRALFADSEFLGAQIAEGAVGAIDTAARPITYGGEATIRALDLQRLASDLGLEWLRDSRYAGAVSGHFRVDGAGRDLRSLALAGSGRLTRADLFGGSFEDAEVTLDIQDGSLRASYDGRFAGVDPSVALADPRFAASLGGSADARIAVRELLVREPQLSDYEVEGSLSLTDSTVRNMTLDRATIMATLSGGTLTVGEARVAGPAMEAEGAGTVELDGTRSSRFDYKVVRGDLALARELLGRNISGQVETAGQLTGPTGALRLAGDGTVTHLDVDGTRVLSSTGTYDLTVPPTDLSGTRAQVSGRASFIEAFGQTILEASGDVSYASERLSIDLQVTPRDGLTGTVAGAAVIHAKQQALDVTALDLASGGIAWRMVTQDPPPTVRWEEAGISLSPMAFVDAASGTQRVDLAGTWRGDGTGVLRVTTSGLFLDTLTRTEQGPASYGGVVDLDATISGTRERPIVTGSITITDGRIRRLSYERLAGRVEYLDGLFEINLQLDQAPGVWLTASGTVPLGVFDTQQPERTMNVAVASTPISLGLIEGLTDVISNVSGQARLNLSVVGSSHHPDVIGSIELTDAGFVVAASGARYSNGRAMLELSKDRIAVNTLSLEDRDGHLVEIRGSLGTHELRPEDLELDVVARRFEVLRNEFGTIDVDARLGVRGRLESPRVSGTVTIAGGELIVDRILDRALFQPYATTAQAPAAAADVIARLNPWERLGLDIELRVPGSLSMTGDNVQVSPGTPLGLGDFNLRATGDLYLYKDPGQPLYVTGSLDQVVGTYVFQGRRFDLDPISSINFRGDLNPELYVAVRRVISGVEARLAIAGPLREPELRLASNPPLEPSDILSLIVFNTTIIELSASQQEQLAVRAGTLAAGFLVGPLMSALERTLGLDVLGIEPASGTGGGTRVTIGDEIAPGLVARFSRQFGQDQYDEATLEYYLSSILRIRATFSDATALIARSPFRRVERAGVDLLLFFSF